MANNVSYDEEHKVAADDEQPAGRGAGELSSRRSQIVTAARELLESGGNDAVTMRAIANKLGIQAPSLYKHFPDKAALEAALVAATFVELADAFSQVARRSRHPLAALGRAYRGWATSHPHLYLLMTNRPLERERLPEGVEAAAAAPIVKACGGDPDRARAAWAFAHGMTSLELANRFPPGADLDAAWRSGLDALQQSTTTPNEGAHDEDPRTHH
ncbi:MAG: TetR/AcrR family transcriptional regulator [Acidimicrobiia bacterium]|jgi:AcrR family transcriptional regulator|nr:TetR/AcrR family transcriptional regulator [Acidimicrobiia bacterium]